MSDPLSLSAVALHSPLLHEMGNVLEVGTVTIGPDFVVRGWNGWLEQASGRTAAAMVGRSLLEVFPELVGSQREAAFRRALAGGTVVLAHRLHRYLLPLPGPTGVEGFDVMQQSARIIPVLRDDLTVDGAIAFIQDVTERVAREEELRAAMLRAESASQAKSDFLASMSHELRTPLSAVVGYAELLAGELTGPVLPAQKEQLERIKYCSWHLLDLVEEILTFARTEAGKEPVDVVEIDARQIVHDAIVLLEPQAAKKRLTVDVHVPETPLLIRTDPTKVRQILVNLVGNAIKFTERGTIAVELAEAGALVAFRVRDTGPGIPVGQTERIFEAFTQLDQSRTRVKGGTGLGLPVSRNLAHLLGGDLQVTSTPGEGSVFVVTIARELGRRVEGALAVTIGEPAVDGGAVAR